MKKLPRPFYDRDTVEVAKDLLGMWLVHHDGKTERIGRIVETESYLGPHDLAAHSAKGRTKRTDVMFGPPGHAYVYLIYGMYRCLNVVTMPEGHAAAVLIRAVEPIKNCDGKTKGPGLLCNALHIGMPLNGADLLGGNLFITKPNNPETPTIVKRPRVGVDYAGKWAKRLLRFYVKDNPFVSKR
ncbi:MAG: DNA-3-methyladenine glycosylase [Candidatus Peribacteraceae bacterium]|nr:DNA-3-methyladenine glycosylase [Candidatus Peribacteraceae bacterium]